MTKWQRFKTVLGSLVTIACAALLALFPEYAPPFIVLILGASVTLMGIRRLVYYLSMARFTIGGRTILYQGVIFLDFGIFTLGYANIPGQYIMIYLLIGYIFSGVIDVMRALEIKKYRSGSWRFKLMVGIVNVALGVLCAAQINSSGTLVYIYCVGIVWSAVGRMINAFRPSAVLYVPQI